MGLRFLFTEFSWSIQLRLMVLLVSVVDRRFFFKDREKWLLFNSASSSIELHVYCLFRPTRAVNLLCLLCLISFLLNCLVFSIELIHEEIQIFLFCFFGLLSIIPIGPWKLLFHVRGVRAWLYLQTWLLFPHSPCFHLGEELVCRVLELWGYL